MNISFPQAAVRFSGRRPAQGIHRNMGDIKESGLSVQGDVQTSIGNVKLTDCEVSGDITSHAGNVSLENTTARRARSSAGNIKATGARLQEADTSAGNVKLSESTVDRVNSSAGNISLKATQAKQVSTSAGNIALKEGSTVNGPLSSHSGRIRINDSTVDGPLSTRSSSASEANPVISVSGSGSRVGEIQVKKPGDNYTNFSSGYNVITDSVVIVNGRVISGNSGSDKKIQVVEITDGAVVRGDITFESGEGIVRLSNGGRLEGRVIGGTLKGEDPPQTPPDTPPPKSSGVYKFL